MANIMLTDICNLKCPYCFANEFVNHGKNEISIENLKIALDFITADGTDRVGLIGGEPTLHSQFEEILKLIIADKRISHVKVFTNGVKIAEYASWLANDKFDIIFNCNSPEDIGERNFQAMYNSLKVLVNEYGMRNKIMLGYNIYSEKQSFDFLLNLLREFHFHVVRMAVTVPNTKEERNGSSHDRYREILAYLKSFIFTMLDNYVIPHYDCNKVPKCIWESDDTRKLNEIFERLPEDVQQSEFRCKDISVFFDLVGCEPVIDIGTDLTAVRCFGLSSCTKEVITDFKSLGDLRRYYLQNFDSIAWMGNKSSECTGCYSKKVMKCSCGCYGYSQDKILRIKERIEDYYKNDE